MAKRLVRSLVVAMMFAVVMTGSATGVAAQDVTVTRVGPIVAGARQACSDNSCTFVLPGLYTLFVVTYPDGNVVPAYDSRNGSLMIFLQTQDDASELLDDYTQSVLSNDSDKPGYQLLAPIVNGTIGGEPAQTFAYSAKNGPNKTQQNYRVYTTLHQGTFYILDFIADPKQADAYFNSVGNILNSFQFT